MDNPGESFVNGILTLSNPLLYALLMTLLGKVIDLSSLDNKHITWILPVAGIIPYCLMEGWTGRHMVEGLTIGLAAIGLNQGFRQWMLKKPGEPTPKTEGESK